jgi:hypothetical protein
MFGLITESNIIHSNIHSVQGFLSKDKYPQKMNFLFVNGIFIDKSTLYKDVIDACSVIVKVFRKSIITNDRKPKLHVIFTFIKNSSSGVSMRLESWPAFVISLFCKEALIEFDPGNTTIIFLVFLYLKIV